MKKLILVSFILLSGTMLSACSTVSGIGKDVSKAGHEIQKAAN